MASIKEAKRAVSVKACRILYEHKELSDHLMPINNLKCIETVRDIYFKHYNNARFVRGELANAIAIIRLLTVDPSY